MIRMSQLLAMCFDCAASPAIEIRPWEGAGDEGYNSLYVVRRTPPHHRTVLENGAVTLSLEDPLDLNRTMVLFATRPMSDDWRQLEPGEMLVARRGAVMWTSHPEAAEAFDARPRDGDRPAGPAPTSARTEAALQSQTPAPDPAVIAAAVAVAPVAGQVQSQGQAMTPPQATISGGEPLAAARAEETKAGLIGVVPTSRKSRVLKVHHATTYRYETPVERSSHLFRLRPRHDPTQDLLEHTLSMSPFTKGRSYEDVFGNYTTQCEIESPYSELRLVAESTVRVYAPPTLSSPDRRSTIPLVWMPWQRQMMMPYLLPPELPETQLRELSEFAMSFVERQDYNLVYTLDDLNRTIYKDFSYVSGSTTIETTPFDVFIHRRGVCQDFANLFICLSRLLGVPARYRVGYIFTGADYDNKIQSEASHAWVEVYLPDIGWRGFDPTNGCHTGIDHIAVAVGRNYRDATPTQGTLYKGGGKEKLEATVRVEEVPDADNNDSNGSGEVN